MIDFSGDDVDNKELDDIIFSYPSLVCCDIDSIRNCMKDYLSKYSQDEYFKSLEYKVFGIINECTTFPTIDINNVTDEDWNDAPTCGKCNGFMYYESGGNIENCDSCIEGKDWNQYLDSKRIVNYELIGKKVYELLNN